MAHSYIIRTIALEERNGFSGSIALLPPSGEGGLPDAVLIAARYGSARKRVELRHRLGVWDLSIAAMTSRIVFRPQVQSVIVKTSKSERTVAFADRARLRALGARLRRDMAYRANSLAFFVAAVDRMIDAEAEHRIRFPLLDEAIDSRERFKERMATRSGVLPLLRGDKKKPGKAGWVGVEVPCFVQCMEDCEEDHDFWEVWVHAYCLAKCAIKCGTGGGALFPD